MADQDGPPKKLKHPFYPWDLSLPDYVPNDLSAPHLVGLFAAVMCAVVLLAWVITGRRKEPFCGWRRLSLCWMLSSAVIHWVLEGYFSVYHSSLAGRSSYLAQMWKEYAKGDSRYLSSDNFTVCMESVTAVVVGSLAFLTFVAFMKGNNSRYTLQLSVSVCQLYGCVLYLLTEAREGFSHGPVGHPLYFWFYFLFLNLLWVVVPLLHIWDAAGHVASCQAVSDFYIDEYNRRMAAINGGGKKLR